MSSPILISAADAAALVDLNPETVKRMARKGSFPRAVRLGSAKNSTIRFDRGEVLAWIEAKKTARAA